MAKRILCTILVLCMLIGLMPAFAAEKLPFTDVKSTAWYYQDVSYAYDNGLMSGMSQTTFGPSGTLTRAMFVTILGRMAGVETAKYPGSSFKDVPTGQWYSPYVEWAAKTKVVSGVGNNQFAPGTNVTREQMATMIFRYMTAYDLETEHVKDPVKSFKDADKVSSWAKDALEQMRVTGIIRGDDKGNFNPKKTATRAEAAAIFHRLDEALKGYQKAVTVVFMTNDGTNSVYTRADVVKGKAVQPPTSPDREGFAFQGWFTDKDCKAAYDFSKPVKDKLTLYAAWEEKAETEGAGGEMASDSYAILDMAIEDGEAAVEISTMDACLLQIEFLDENTNSLIGEAAMMAAPNLQVEIVTLPVDVDLPEHFLAVAHLRDTEGNELCNQLTCIWYTTNYEKYDEQTVDDFDDRVVVNFDEDKQENFGVLVDGAKELTTGSAEVNGNTYVFDNADSDLKALKRGDVAVIYPDSGDPILLKVDSLKTEGDKVTIQADPADTEMEDYYDVLKLDLVLDAGAAEVDTSEACVEDLETGEVTPVQVYETGNSDAAEPEGIDLGGFDDEWSLSKDIELTLPVFSLDLSKKGTDGKSKENASFDITASYKSKTVINIKAKYDAILFGKDYLYYKTECTTKDGEFKLNFEASWAPLKQFNKEHLSADDLNIIKTKDLESYTGKKEVKLGKIVIPTNVPCLSVQFGFSVPLDLKLNASASFTQTFSNKCGTVYSTTDGEQKISEKSSELQLSVQGSVSVKFGPKFKLSVNVFDEVLEASISAWAGLSASATAHMNFVDASYNGTAESLHRCFLCVDGKVEGFLDITVSVDVKITEHFLNGNIVSWDIIGLSAPLFRFYLSLINEGDSVFQGKPHFEAAWAGKSATCKNQVYRTAFLVEDADGNNVSNAQFTVTKASGGAAGSGTSGKTLYLYPGSYKVSAKVGNKNLTRSFTVDSSGQDIVLRESTADGSLKGKVTNADDNSVITGAKVEVYSGGTLVASKDATGNDGTFSFPLGMGTYLLKITADGYIPFSSYETVNPGAETVAQTALLVNGGDYQFGGLSGQITDALTGDPVEGATVEIYKNWNSTDVSDRVNGHVVTDDNGEYCFDIQYLFNVPIGSLNAGYYTVVVAKDGYETGRFNTVVQPGKVRENQNGSIMPSGSGTGEYSIVLRWDALPEDLDSHLNAVNKDGGRVHVFYSDSYCDEANLDVDDTDSYGPETVTVIKLADLKAGFTYSVHDYTNRDSDSSSALSGSGANVTLYHNGKAERVFHVPADKVGTVWNVFSVNSQGQIKVLNTFENINDPEGVGQGYATVLGSAVPFAVHSAPLKDYEKTP